ncbi:ankyrin repeat-containing domain protein [Aspergillus multicolor]|uniref:ankyrin repeat domain-containing protein n=1 Tax=Aspergillus multicolor TaxID=41759 RepID=UPI003CCE3D03
MHLLDLPNELLLSIGHSIESEADLNSFLQSCRHLHNVLLEDLHRSNAKHHGSFCLHWVIELRMIATAKKAIYYRVDVNAPMKFPHYSSIRILRFSMPPLRRAVEKGCSEIVIALLEAAADVESPQSSTYSPLVAAVEAEQGSLEIVKILLNHGANMNKVNEFKLTPLLVAVYEKKPEIARFLLAHGGDPNVTGRDSTPLDAALFDEDEEIIILLQEHGGVRLDKLPAELELPLGNLELP